MTARQMGRARVNLRFLCPPSCLPPQTTKSLWSPEEPEGHALKFSVQRACKDMGEERQCGNPTPAFSGSTGPNLGRHLPLACLFVSPRIIDYYILKTYCCFPSGPEFPRVPGSNAVCPFALGAVWAAFVSRGFSGYLLLCRQYVSLLRPEKLVFLVLCSYM